MWFAVVVSPFLLALASGQDFAPECPSPYGYFADSVQCDRYYQCEDNVLTEKLCPDGMAFVDGNPKLEKCDYIGHVDCTGRPELQPAQSTPNCPRKNGYFAHPDETICNEFYFCNEGKGSPVTCPAGLLFSKKTHNCGWEDVAGRTGCIKEETGDFQCPKVSTDVANAHPRYPDPTDCQYFYVCISGVNPRRNGCAFGQVFNSETSACSVPRDVPECADYYTEYFEEYFNTLSTTQGLARGDIIAAAINAGFEVPSLKDKVGGSGSQATSRRRLSRPRAQVAKVPAPAPAPAPARPPPPPRAPARQEFTVEIPPAPAAPQPTSDRFPHRLQGRRPEGSSGTRQRFRPLPATSAATTSTTALPPQPSPPPQQPPLDYADYYVDQADPDPAFYDYAADPAPAPSTTALPTPPPPTTELPRRTISLRRRINQRSRDRN